MSPTKGAYYNEIDKGAAAWLRELIKAGLIADGDVDERSIAEVRPDDLKRYTQCHFFAGIGGWSYALRLAGWDDSRPVWTGSCPCQPFSVAGKGRGTADERHLWPEFARLIAECHPAIVFGEQVASKAGREWLAGVRLDLEGMGYAVGAADLCAASVGAPHIRQRLYWVADSGGERRQQERRGASGHESANGGQQNGDNFATGCGATGGVADSNGHGSLDGVNRSRGRWPEATTECGGAGWVADSSNGRAERPAETFAGGNRAENGIPRKNGATGGMGDADDTGPQGRSERPDQYAGQLSAWAASDTISCADGKARRIEPSAFPLAHGVPARVGRLRGYGNAIVPQVAATFIAAFTD